MYADENKKSQNFRLFLTKKINKNALYVDPKGTSVYISIDKYKLRSPYSPTRYRYINTGRGKGVGDKDPPSPLPPTPKSKKWNKTGRGGGGLQLLSQAF